jgi:SAM-dependent methyltransferase
LKQYFEDLWAALPEALEVPDFDLRLRFLLQDVTAGVRALDLGCGEGVFTAALAHAGADVVGADVADAALARAERAHPELRFMLVPVEGPLPFADGAFELVWASEVIEHVADTARWLSEVRRVLTPRGRLLLTTPNHGRVAVLVHGIERYSDPLGDHLHLYTRRSLSTLLREFGFAEIELRAAVGLPPLRRLLLARAMR